MEFLDYFNASAPKSELMNFVREEILKVYPEAGERVSYQMPSWIRKENEQSLLYAMPTKKHLGFYPLSAYIQKRASELEAAHLKFTKGAIQVPFDYPRDKLSALIVDIIHFNLENPYK